MVGPSFNFSKGVWSANEQFAVVGPVPVGYVIERITIFVRASGVATILIGVSLSSSGKAGLAAFVGGRHLINSVDKTTGGGPAINTILAAEPGSFIEVPVGIVIETGPAFVHWSYTSDNPNLTTGVFGVWVNRPRAA